MPVPPGHVSELRKLGLRIRDKGGSLLSVAHPELSRLRGVHGSIFIGLPNAEGADLRSATVFASGQVDRSPCRTTMAAVMTVLDAMGLLAVDRPFVHESIIGTRFIGSVESRTMVARRLQSLLRWRARRGSPASTSSSLTMMIG